MPPSRRRTRISAARLERALSPAGMLGAVLLHAAIIAATFFTWSHRLDIADESPPVVPVDLVTVADKTDIAPMVKEEPKTPPKDETQPPEPAPAPPTPQVPAEEAPPPPDQATSEPLIAKPPPPIVPKIRPRPEPKPESKPESKKEKFDIDNIKALLDKRTPAASSAPNAKVGNRNIKGVGAQNAMTMDLVDALRNQIAQCWSPPVGAPSAERLIVSFELFLNPDGSVAQPPQLIDSPASGDSFGRAAAEAARRAIYTCAPYKLPADRYAQWRDITFVFDPRQMVGQ